MAGNPIISNAGVMACRSCPCFTNTDRVCDCGNPTVTRLSMTPGNPLRRFAQCRFNGAPHGCEFFDWVDEPLCDHVKTPATSMIVRNATPQADLGRTQRKLSKALAERQKTMGRFIEAESLARALKKSQRRLRWIMGFLVVVVLCLWFA